MEIQPHVHLSSLLSQFLFHDIYGSWGLVGNCYLDIFPSAHQVSSFTILFRWEATPQPPPDCPFYFQHINIKLPLDISIDFFSNSNIKELQRVSFCVRTSLSRRIFPPAQIQTDYCVELIPGAIRINLCHREV